MPSILGGLIVLYLHFGKTRTPPLTSLEVWFVKVPFSIYLGWILMLTRETDYTYVAVLVWAFIGIASKQAENSPCFPRPGQRLL